MCANVTTSEKGTARSLVGLRERSNNHGIVAEVARKRWEEVVGKLKKNRGGVYWKPLVGKTFQTVAFEWSSIVRRTPLPRFTMLGFIGHTHAPRSSLALSFPPIFLLPPSTPPRFPSFSVFLSAPVLNFLLFLSFLLSFFLFFFSFYPIHRKFIEHHFPATTKV